MLKLTEVKKLYDHKNGIKRVNLTIEKGQVYLFVGENGSGKSTTIKLIAKVIFNKKGEGQILNEFKRIIYLPDKRNYPMLLKSSIYLKYYLDQVKLEVIQNALEKYAIPNEKIGSFSKGMLQKLGIVQTLLLDGDLYLFDEPTDGLDKEAIEIFINDLETLQKVGKTIIISTHNKTIYRSLNPKITTFKEGINK